MNFLIFRDFFRIFLNFLDLFLFKNTKKLVFISRADVAANVVGADNTLPHGDVCTLHLAHACACVCLYVHVCA